MKDFLADLIWNSPNIYNEYKRVSVLAFDGQIACPKLIMQTKQLVIDTDV